MSTTNQGVGEIVRSRKELLDQVKTLLPMLGMIYFPTFIVLLAIGLLADVTGNRVWFFTNDPFVLGGLPWYAGIISNIGLLLWCGSASVCFFSMTLLRMVSGSAGRDWKQFFLFSGILTSLLLLDDLFQLHQILYPRYLHLNAIAVYGFYGLFTVYYLWLFRRTIWETEFLLLALSMGLFALAIVCDILPIIKRGRTAISDGFKLFGIVTWTTYHCRTCFRVIRCALRE